MLVTFKSKASSEVIMFEQDAKRILDLLHKDVKIGVITAAEGAAVIARLEQETSESRAHPASDSVQRDIAAHHNDQGDDSGHEPVQTVNFANKIYPLLEMLREAHKHNNDVLWGV
ncbi:DUF1840 domain-containing protein [Collimonas sp.]|jgi:hypothetical protein|uniref:DUF1840 domain-containing protein n=1 Tax=Collimonas sp. TaxID=1963772 RepID=UPI002B739F1E|nr:DUF1840 domain-containing protein [Collimonas sp.]HWX02687.1 DUF1840 domain-containing protein [Collimonas sp.]